MPIQTVNGNDFYNYEIKDARIVDQDSYRNLLSRNASSFRVNSQSQRIRRKEGKCRRFQKFLYNRDNKTSCNRTGKHWGALIFYFAFFLGIIFVLFFCYFYGINRTMNSSTSFPAEKKFHSSAVPTFAFVPVNTDHPLPIVWYKTRDDKMVFVDSIKSFYERQTTLCMKQRKKECSVEPSFYGPCGEGTFGYDENRPCFLLKLNTRSGWRPDAYHSSLRVPAALPEELKMHLDLKRETLCVYCEGMTAYDAEKIGKVDYYPEYCYKDSAFPFSPDPIDVNPSVAIKLNNIQPRYLVELSCRIFGVDADGTGEHQQSIYIYIDS